MKTLLISAILCFSFFSSFAIEPPKICTACRYGFSQQGEKYLVGANRAYYGSEKRNTAADFSAKPSTSDSVLLLGNVYPGMGVTGKALFWNYDDSGTAHLTELDGSVKVFKRKGATYAFACENLLQIAAYQKTAKAPEPKPAPVIMERETIYVSAPIQLPPAIVEKEVVVERRPQVIGEVYLLVTEISTFRIKNCRELFTGSSYSNGVLVFLTPMEMVNFPRTIDKFYNPYGVGTVTSIQLRNVTPGDSRMRQAISLQEYYSTYHPGHRG